MQTTKPVPVLDIFTIQLDLLQPLAKTQEGLELAQPKLYQATDTPAYLALSPPKLKSFWVQKRSSAEPLETRKCPDLESKAAHLLSLVKHTKPVVFRAGKPDLQQLKTRDPLAMAGTVSP